MDPTQKLRRTRGPGQDLNPGSNADQFLILFHLSKMCGTPKKVPKVSASLDPSFGPKNHLCFASRFIGSAEDANRDYFCGPGDANSAPFASAADLAMENDIAFCGRNCVGGPGCIDTRCH